MCVCVCLCVCTFVHVACLYLGLQCVPLLYIGVKLPGVEGELHLSQEAVVSEAVVVPHGQLQRARLQLGVADGVLR